MWLRTGPIWYIRRLLMNKSYHDKAYWLWNMTRINSCMHTWTDRAGLQWLGFWGWKLSLNAIIVQNTIQTEDVSTILVWSTFKLEKNCLKDGKNTILCSDFGKFWKSGLLQAVAHQNLGKWPLVYLYSVSEKSYPARGRKDIGLVAFGMAFWPWFFWSKFFFKATSSIVVPWFSVSCLLSFSNSSYKLDPF